MNVTHRFTILGCGSSPGVPRINGDWGACNPENPKNRRLRASFLVEQIAENGARTIVVIDTGPDFREQMIAAKVPHLDAVLYTHAHADHLHGIDDIRGYFITQRHRIPIFADAFTMERIRAGFGYCLETPPGSDYPPIVKANILPDHDTPILINGAGGPMTFLPMTQQHASIQSLGFRIGNVAYCTDVSDFPDDTVEKLQSLDLLILDTLQYAYHPSHLSLAQALDWIERLQPKRTVLTHMHVPLDYDTVMAETPDHVEPGYDGWSADYVVTL
jgi:phosphoribosyl 1,2-cyclic phosphate phosphodiesterase